MRSTVKHSVKPLNRNGPCLMAALDYKWLPLLLQRWRASLSSNPQSEHNSGQRTCNIIKFFTLRMVLFIFMSISDKDVIILYASIINRNCHSMHSSQALAYFLGWHNIVDDFLHYTTTGWLPSQSFVDESTKDYLQDIYHYDGRRLNLTSVHLATPITRSW
jgi:hypothetical protein